MKKCALPASSKRLRVDVIEAGFAAASNGDFESVQAIARVVKKLDGVLALAGQ